MSTPAPWSPLGKTRREQQRTRLRAAWTLAAVAALSLAAYLGAHLRATQWAMDADEAVHAVEALRLHEHLAHGELLAFLRDTYFPERWHPPVQPHVRWYPFVHAWVLQPFYLLLGPSDFSARLPSVVLLVGTALVFFELARRLAPRTPAASALFAVLLLLAAPNVLTFSAQSLIAAAALFFTYLALLGYLWSLEEDHALDRAIPAGIALGLAVLTKYDHGGFLALVLGVLELHRVRWSLPRLVRTGSAALFGVALLMILAWFAHPEKLAALGDSVRHPFPPSLARTVRDTALTLFVEYAASIAVGLGGLLAFVQLRRRLDEPALRAVWVWALAATLFYVVRGRFYFRYGIVEAPAFLLFLAVQLPLWGQVLTRALARPATRREGWLALGAWSLSALVLLVASFVALRPELALHVFEPLPLGIGPEHVGFFSWTARSLIALALGAFGLAAARLMLARGAAAGPAALVVASCLAVTAVPGAVALYRELPARVDWELEGHPELRELYDFVNRTLPEPGNVVLAGGWDQLTNNSLRWYLLTARPDPLPFDRVTVGGDMIGSIVFPPEPRVAWWTQRLATAPIEELPEHVVLVTPGESFLYRTWLGNEVSIYRRVLEARQAYAPVATGSFPTLGCTVEILARRAVAPPLESVPDVPPYRRRGVSPDGWGFLDDALRHFLETRHDPRRADG